MKRTKFLALALVVAIMMMGAGYAYWQEDLLITNTVKTGQLDFTFQDADITIPTNSYIYESSYCRVKDGDDNTIEISLDNMYPGAEATVDFELLNSGSMKAKLKNFDIPETFDEKAFILVKTLKIDGTEVTLPTTQTTSLDNLVKAFEDKKILIEPLDKVSFEITLQIDPDATEANVAEELGGDGGSAIEFSLTADGLQYNDDTN